MVKCIIFRMASQMVFSGTANCPAFKANPWKADICQVMVMSQVPADGNDIRVRIGSDCEAQWCDESWPKVQKWIR